MTDAPTGPLLGCDFSSAPSVRKPIVVAVGHLHGGDEVRLDRLESFMTLEAWQHWLAAQPAWVGAFDFPFGLPRELVEALNWPLEWEACMRHYASLPRAEVRETFARFCAARPVGRKFAHRRTDGPAGASPSMKWVNPPVAYMLHAGVPRLLAAGAHLPGLGGAAVSDRIALEGYPGLLARELIGRRSYKSDDRARQTPERLEARRALLEGLQAGRSRLGLRLVLSRHHEQALAADASGDRLDAALCLVEAAWGALRADSPGPGFGLPPGVDPLEGWIVCA
ncbi:MAG: DUF429 domain-containing protein [Variovorax paradoxus]|uniref:DUF429 domain-containing protein n=1 Tax=Variovorax paradoxus TaxID=34073 RepID=A0A2W5PVL1_VARPD|nr:MAG: DUF429 domain-containing protein [Variovorax paradoxus]